MSLSHCLVSEIRDQGHSSPELVNLVLQVLVDTPLSDFLIKALNLLLEFNCSVIHIFDSQLIESDILP